MSNNEQMAALALFNGRDESLKALKPQYDLARGDLTGSDYYQPFYDTGLRGSNLYADALGLNGGAGTSRAQQAYAQSPGYQFQLGQGLEALNRTAASRGMLASGNNTADILNYSQGLASQDYGNWLNRLSGVSDMGMTAAGGRQAKQGALSALDYGYGTDQAGIWQGTARALADTAMQQEKIDSQKTNGPLSAILGGVNLLSGALGAFRK